jgi:anhydro-N-acetylmuramic acid kinase
MSGTSLDGVDAVLGIETGGHWTFPQACHQPYPESLRSEALALCQPGNDELRRSALLANHLSDLYADVVRELLTGASLAPGDVAAIGCHGQTVRHAPHAGYTLQIVNAARLTEATRITVVSDFRSRDVAAGGQGAPLVPAFHEALFRSTETHRVILNLGGIANLTDLAPDRETRGFDCGPANMLMDAWIARHRQLPFDRHGAWAAEGQILPDLLQRLLGHHFLALPPPKSCGREEFGLPWLDGRLGGTERPVDVQATLVAFTVQCVADALMHHCPGASELYVCGGGARNDALMDALAKRCPGLRIACTDSLGLPAEHVEAAAFAWLAARCLDGRAGNLPAVTGARGPRVLGAIHPA